MRETGIKWRFVLVCVIGIFFSLRCFSQDDNGTPPQVDNSNLAPSPPPAAEYFYRGSLEGGGGIAIPFSNKALRISLSGQYYLHLSANYIVAHHIFAGLEFENTELGSTSSIAAFNTLMFIYNAGVKAGYYTYMQHDFLFCYSLCLGPSLITYTQSTPALPKNVSGQSSYFVAPNIMVGYRLNDELRIGLEASYILLPYRFDPGDLGLSQLVNYSSRDTSAPTSYFEIGFGFYWAFAEVNK